MPQYIKQEGEVISLVPKYRLGKKNKRVIIEVETGHEYLIFPQSKTEHIQEFLNFLNGKESKPVEETNEDEIWRKVISLMMDCQNITTELTIEKLKSKFTITRK